MPTYVRRLRPYCIMLKMEEDAFIEKVVGRKFSEQIEHSNSLLENSSSDNFHCTKCIDFKEQTFVSDKCVGNEFSSSCHSLFCLLYLAYKLSIMVSYLKLYKNWIQFYSSKKINDPCKGTRINPTYTWQRILK